MDKDGDREKLEKRERRRHIVKEKKEMRKGEGTKGREEKYEVEN